MSAKRYFFGGFMLLLWLLIGTNAALGQTHRIHVKVTGTGPFPEIAPISLNPVDPAHPNTTVAYHFVAVVADPPWPRHLWEIIPPPVVHWKFTAQYKALLTDKYQEASPDSYSQQTESQQGLSASVGFWFFKAGHWQVAGAASVTYISIDPVHKFSEFVRHSVEQVCSMIGKGIGGRYKARKSYRQNPGNGRAARRF